jgi:hypothetical protein
MSFGTDEFRALQGGRFDEKRAIECMFTELGSSLYTYMVMLKNVGRERESEVMDSLRKRIFELRSLFYSDKYGQEQHNILRDIWVEINTTYRCLQIYKPEESCILDSTANHCAGLSYIVKEHLKLE